MGDKLREILAELRRELEGIYGDRLVKMILFGSQARGDAEGGSDIDVLVVLEGGGRPAEETRRTADLRAELSLSHDMVVSLLFVSADRYLGEQSPLMINVRREGVLV